LRKSNEELDKFLKERPNQKELVDRNILKGTYRLLRRALSRRPTHLALAREAALNFNLLSETEGTKMAHAPLKRKHPDQSGKRQEAPSRIVREKIGEHE
jgi:hypothetical protein